MAEAEQQQAAQESAAAELSLLDQIVEEGRFGAEESAKQRGRDMISAFVTDVLSESVTYSKDTEAMLNEQIRQIDELLSAQLNEVMHHEKFKSLESSWRGLRYLVSQTETGPQLKIRVMSISRDELQDDLTSGKAEMAVDRSELFKKIYQAEFNQFGGTPYGAMIGDFAFDKKGQDMKLLTRIVAVGGCRPRAVHRRHRPQHVRLRELHRAEQRLRARECLRVGGIRAVERVPEQRGLPLRGADRAPDAHS